MLIPRPLITAVLALQLAACGGDAGVPAEAFPGHLLVREANGRELVTLPARATFCLRDSLVALSAVGARWAGALAIGVTWPGAPAGEHPVRRVRDSSGVAAMALRPLGTANDTAWSAFEGIIRRTSARDSLVGSFEATLVRGERDTMRVTGTFASPAPTLACP